MSKSHHQPNHQPACTIKLRSWRGFFFHIIGRSTPLWISTPTTYHRGVISFTCHDLSNWKISKDTIIVISTVFNFFFFFALSCRKWSCLIYNNCGLCIQDIVQLALKYTLVHGLIINALKRMNVYILRWCFCYLNATTFLMHDQLYPSDFLMFNKSFYCALVGELNRA